MNNSPTQPFPAPPALDPSHIAETTRQACIQAALTAFEDAAHERAVLRRGVGKCGGADAAIAFARDLALSRPDSCPTANMKPFWWSDKSGLGEAPP